MPTQINILQKCKCECKHHAWCTQFLGLESRPFVEVLEKPCCQERMTEVMTEGIAPVWRSRRSLGCQGLAAQGNNPGGMQFKSGLKNA